MATQSKYAVSVFPDPPVDGALRITFVPKRTRNGQIEGEAMEPAQPQYSVTVTGHGAQKKFNWIKPPAQAALRETLENESQQRVTARHDWLEKLRSLMVKVKGWADELDWATRFVDKEMEDSEFGKYKTSGLLLQKDSVRLFFKPITRSAPGTEGVVDLCLMPSYNDIASLYYYNDRWNVHYAFEEDRHTKQVLEAEGKLLSKSTLRKVFDEMTAHAGVENLVTST